MVGATSGGSKFEIIPEVTQVEVDGALVAVAELDVKTGETASMEINFAELTPDIIQGGSYRKEWDRNRDQGIQQHRVESED